MSMIVQRSLHNLRILWIGIVIVVVWAMVWFNNQTASFTNVFDQGEVSSTADVVIRYQEDGIRIATLKEYDALSWGTFRITFFVPQESQSEFEASVQSSYWFFVTNHNTSSVITLYLPEHLEINTELLSIWVLSQMPLLDSIVLFEWDFVDEIVVQQKSSQTQHN